MEAWDKFAAQKSIRNLYRDSLRVLKNIKETDELTWLVICSFLAASYINTALQKARGNWRNGLLVMPPQVLELAEYGASNKYGFFADFLLDWKNIPDWDTKNRAKALALYPSLQYLESLTDQEFLQFYAQSLQNVITKRMPSLSAEIIVYRGYAGADPNVPAIKPITDYRMGEQWVNWGFLSTSLDANISAYFMDRQQGCCLLEIHVHPAVHAILITTHPTDSAKKQYPTYGVGVPQAEVLLPAGLILEFRGIKETQEHLKLYGKDYFVNVARVRVVGQMK